MRIGILGTGNMAEALGGQWARARHEILLGGRSPSRTEALAHRIGARAGSLADAAAFGDATLVALPYDAALGVLARAGGLSGRTLIDCTNAIGPGFTLTTEPGRGAARTLAEATGAHVVKAFNHCTPAVWRLTPPAFADGPLAVPLCGDDETSLERVRTLVRDIGCVPLTVGGLERADLLEATTAFLVGLWLGGEEPRPMLPPLAALSG